MARHASDNDPENTPRADVSSHKLKVDNPPGLAQLVDGVIDGVTVGVTEIVGVIDGVGVGDGGTQ